jgi:predicted RNA-binding Zn-ribbon protein involved in translation (DUF1610 family)
VVPGAGRWLAALRAAAPDAAAVRLSDALVFGYACANCGVTPEAANYVGRRAAALDDRIMQCPHCGELSVDVDVRTETTVTALAQAFGAERVPAKFLLAEDVVIDMEEA